MPPRSRFGHYFLQMIALLNAAAPLEFRSRGCCRTNDVPHQNLVIFRIAGRCAIDDELVPDFQCEAVDSALGQLGDAAPFATPAGGLAILVGDFDADKGM